MPRKKRLWSHSEGSKGSTVVVYERKQGGPLYARAFDPSLAGGTGGYRRISLSHTDRIRAETYALEQAAKLRQGLSDLTAGKVTLVQLFVAYRTHRTPRKTSGEQEEDQRRIDMWTRFLGPRKDPHVITLKEWEEFQEQRGTGMLRPDGTAAAPDKRRPVRVRTVEADLKWLRWVLNWGTRWRSQSGRYLLRENAVRGFEIPTEQNPRRPVATNDRYESIRAVSDRVTMELRWVGAAVRQRSYLSELLDIAHGTGRRITAVCALRYQDLRLEETGRAPYGTILWPEDTDKEGREWLAPMSQVVRAAVDRVLRDRPGIGGAFLFPSPTDRTRPVQYTRARTWLLEAERLAAVPKQRGSLFHAYRRAWATARKHLPVTDVAAAGGWKSTVTIQRCYQQPDEATILSVVLGGAELRERKA